MSAASIESADKSHGDLEAALCELGAELVRRTTGGTPRMIALTTSEIKALISTADMVRRAKAAGIEVREVGT